MKSVLEQLIGENDFLEDGLYHGYINLTSLATYLLPRVENISGKKTTVPSITMTLSRISRDLQSAQYVRIRPEELTIRTGVRYIDFEKAPGLSAKLFALHGRVPEIKLDDGFFSLSEGVDMYGIIYSREFFALVDEVQEDYEPQEYRSGLSLLIVRISQEQYKQKGIIYYITKQLSFFDVSIVEMRTSATEVMILIHEEDKKKAVSILG